MEMSVMVVDDDAFFRKMVADLLRKHGFKVTTASSWMDFSKQYHSRGEPPDVVLLDINLGGVMSGDKILQTLKKGQRTASPAAKTPKLLLISSCPEEELKAKADEVKADGYIMKDTLTIAAGASFLNKMKKLAL